MVASIFDCINYYDFHGSRNLLERQRIPYHAFDIRPFGSRMMLIATADRPGEMTYMVVKFPKEAEGAVNKKREEARARDRRKGDGPAISLLLINQASSIFFDELSYFPTVLLQHADAAAISLENIASRHLFTQSAGLQLDVLH